MKPLIILAALLATPAAAQDWTGFYAGAGLSSDRVTFGGEKKTFRGTSVAVGYLKDIGDIAVGGEIAGFSESADVGDVHNTLIKAILGYDLGKTLVYASAGSSDLTIDLGGAFGDKMPFYGIGIKRAISDHLVLNLEAVRGHTDDFLGTFLHIKAASESVSLRLDYRF